MSAWLKVVIVVLILPACVFAQDDEWPSLSYLRSDYKAVSIVAHIRIQQAEITNRVGGYENWKISAVVLEPFKGKFKKGDVIEYFTERKQVSNKSISLERRLSSSSPNVIAIGSYVMPSLKIRHCRLLKTASENCG